MVVSIHASPQRQGEQIRQVLYKRNILVSIHASPQRQGELRNNIALHLFSECFNPRLTSAARRTPRDAALYNSPDVSIHASPQRQGEHYAEMQIGRFQRVSIHASPQRQGEQMRIREFEWKEYVSIHASPQRQGEPDNRAAVFVRNMGFNPRLTSAARRTRRLQLKMSNLFKFQSTPHLSGKANLCLR